MNTQDLALFVATADLGSISRAAEHLGITAASASAALKRLERQLNVSLFIRSTRALRITSQGEHYLAYCRSALEQLDSGVAALNSMQGKVTGELRIAAPSDLGRNLLLFWMDDIMTDHPDLSIHLMLSDAITDFYNDKVDLAIRYGPVRDDSVVAFRIAKTRAFLFAAPHYLEQFGTPQTPEELQNHNCMLFNRDRRTYNEWRLKPDNPDLNDPVTIQVSGNRTSNDSEVVHRWVVAGKGIAAKAPLEMRADIDAGRVIRLLPEYSLSPMDLHLICPSRHQVSPAVLKLRDLLREKFACYEKYPT